MSPAEWDETVPAELVDVADCAAAGCEEITTGHELAVTGTTEEGATRVVAISLCPKHQAALDGSVRRTSPQLTESVYRIICESTYVGRSIISNVQLAEATGKSLRTIEHTVAALRGAQRIAIRYDPDTRHRIIVPSPF